MKARFTVTKEEMDAIALVRDEFHGNGIRNCYPDEVDNFISITVPSICSTSVNALISAWRRSISFGCGSSSSTAQGASASGTARAT